MQMKLVLLFIIFFITIKLSSSIDFPSSALPSSSGYLTVNQTTGSSIFYTYYEAKKPISSLHNTPLVIWLQGGPGCSSMIGNFYELGPWRIVPYQGTIKLEQNPGSWNRLFGLLFLDNPIGAGFSIAKSRDEIPRDQYQVAKHLFAAIRDFIGLNPGFGSRPVYITGESYAGKYVPAIGYYILMKNNELDDDDDERVNLAGLAIGDGLTDPRTQVMTHADQAYYFGLINEKQRTQLESAQREAVRLVDRGLWAEATNARNHVLRMLQNMTGLATLYNFRRTIPYKDDLVGELLNNAGVKAALGASPLIVWNTCNDVVGDALHADVMKSVRFLVEDILVKSTMKLLLYQGQCDLRDGVVSAEAWMKKLKWDGIDEFLDAERKVWKVNGELAGYVQKWRCLSHVVVLNAGHLVPTDQAVHSQAMIEDWILERGLFVEEKSVGDGRTSPRAAL